LSRRAVFFRLRNRFPRDEPLAGESGVYRQRRAANKLVVFPRGSARILKPVSNPGSNFAFANPLLSLRL
jgi:hypothetical protein